MLLQAVLERYGEKLPGVTAEAMVKEFLGPAPLGGDKIKGGEGSFANRGALVIDTNMDQTGAGGVETMDQSEPGNSQQSQMQEFIDRTKYIPIRLDLSERKLLRLCEAALNVSIIMKILNQEASCTSELCYAVLYFLSLRN